MQSRLTGHAGVLCGIVRATTALVKVAAGPLNWHAPTAGNGGATPVAERRHCAGLREHLSRRIGSPRPTGTPRMALSGSPNRASSEFSSETTEYRCDEFLPGRVLRPLQSREQCDEL